MTENARLTNKEDRRGLAGVFTMLIGVPVVGLIIKWVFFGFG